MAIDRTPFNALVDDIGDGVSGSIWNKNAIKSVILDPVDAAEFGSRVTVPFNAANFSASSGAWTVSAGNIIVNEYSVAGKVMVWNLYCYLSTITGTPANLYVTLPAFSIPYVGQFWSPGWAAENGGVPVTGVMITGQDGTHLRVAKVSGANWVAGQNVLAFCIPILLS
jgi:hypothetical protein